MPFCNTFSLPQQTTNYLHNHYMKNIMFFSTLHSTVLGPNNKQALICATTRQISHRVRVQIRSRIIEVPHFRLTTLASANSTVAEQRVYFWFVTKTSLCTDSVPTSTLASTLYTRNHSNTSMPGDTVVICNSL